MMKDPLWLRAPQEGPLAVVLPSEGIVLSVLFSTTKSFLTQVLE